jgi:hypothetical protein
VVVNAQTSGIRFIFPEFSKVYADKSMWATYQLGMGYDHDFNERLSMGFDAVIDLQRATESGLSSDVTYQGYTGSYYLSDKVFSVQYRTAFALSDNDEGHLYLGTFIGVRTVKQTADLSYVSDPTGSLSGNGPFVSTAEGKKTLIPMGLRFGVRGSLEGGYADLYTQLGYVVGGGESTFTQPYFKGTDFDLTNMAFTLGLAYGFGW